MDEPPVNRVLAELRLRFGDGKRHLHADHEIPIQDQPELADDLDNYQTLCGRCHDRKTMKEVKRKMGQQAGKERE